MTLYLSGAKDQKRTLGKPLQRSIGKRLLDYIQRNKALVLNILIIKKNDRKSSPDLDVLGPLKRGNRS